MSKPPGGLWTTARIALARARLHVACRGPFRRVDTPHHSLPTTLMGLTLSNPVGLAAGMDKSAILAGWTGVAGFGFHEIGSVSLENMNTVSANLYPRQGRDRADIVGVNIACSRRSDGKKALSQYITLAEHFLPMADYLVLNLSSPFTRRARQSGADWLTALLSKTVAARTRYQDTASHYVPLAVKVTATDDGSVSLLDSLDLTLASGFDGAIVATPNTMTEQAVLKTLREAKVRLGTGSLVSVGGITTAEHVRDRLACGASAVQVFSAVVDEGPDWARRVVSELMLDRAEPPQFARVCE